jgi:putative transposon-encoded protein
LEKIFYSNNCCLKLEFHINGGLSGMFYPFCNLRKIRFPVSGLYLAKKTELVLAFTCKIDDPNLHESYEVVFHGEVFKYGSSKKCLILKWLTNKHLLGVDFINCDVAFMFDKKKCDFKIETQDLQSALTKNS